MDVLHGDLEAVEAARLRQLDLRREALDEVLVDNAVRGGEKGEDVGDEVALVVAQLLPVRHVVLQGRTSYWRAVREELQARCLVGAVGQP